jgi:hypothetical protein
MLKRYIGPIDEVTVTIAGQDYGMVKSGDAIPIPDDVADSVSWPESNWEDVKSKSLSKKDDKEADSSFDSPETETNPESGEIPETVNETAEIA